MKNQKINEDQKRPVLKLGITMAGSISAGAYIAGVVDYLLEALDRWEKAKSLNRKYKETNDKRFDPTLPMHDVEIEVLGGSSGGGVTSVLTSAMLNCDFKPARYSRRDQPEYLRENLLYNTWVNLKPPGSQVSGEMHEPDMETVGRLMSNDDIEEEGGIVSLLNSQFIDDLADGVKDLDYCGIGERNYVSKNLKVFVTLSNLYGYDYETHFKRAQSNTTYSMINHTDMALFQLGSGEGENGKIPVSFTDGVNIDLMTQAAKATSAFPIGLKARSLAREKDDIYSNPAINLTRGKGDVARFKLPGKKEEPYESLFVDGGMLDNEPFSRMDKILREECPPQLTNPRKGFRHADNIRSTIIMIDPFPSAKRESQIFDPKHKFINNVIGKVYQALRNQAVFKRDDIVRGFDPDDSSLFLIAPVRNKGENEDRAAGKKAIACGSFSGFGGFMFRYFRHHDFYLGRKNCQSFLRKHFAIPEDTLNPIFEFTDPMKDKYRITKENEDGDEYYMPIIPWVDWFSAETDEDQFALKQQQLPYPQIKPDDIRGFDYLFTPRILAFQKNILTYFKVPWQFKILINIFGGGIRKRIKRMLFFRIVKSMEDWELIPTERKK